MLVTEEQARVQWCPMVRVGEQHNGAAENRPDGSLNCIASECMMWRFEQHRLERTRTERGYCGLAGKPEVAGSASAITSTDRSKNMAAQAREAA